MRLSVMTAIMLVALVGPAGAAWADQADLKAASPKHGSAGVIWFESSHLVRASADALNAGEYDRVIELGRQALDLVLSPGDQAGALNNLCVALTFRFRYDEALKACDRLIRITLPNWRYYNNRANVHLQSGKIDLAIADYQQAIGLASALEAQVEEEVTPTGSEETMKISEVLQRNLDLARDRKTLGLEGVSVGDDIPTN